MPRVLVRRRSPIATLLSLPWLSGWLKVAGDFLTGPRVRVSLPLTSLPGARFRPVEIVVPETSILTTTLRVPKAAIRDLSFAIDLMIQRDTPFEAAELLIHADEIASSGPDELAFLVRMLPRSQFGGAATTWRLMERRLARLSLEATGPTSTSVDFARLLHGRLNWRSWVPLVPLALCLGGGVHIWLSEMDMRTVRIAALQDKVEVTISQLAVVKRQRDETDASQKVVDAMLSLLDRPTTYEGLVALSAMLPADSEVSRIDVKDDELKFSLRSGDLLADIQSMNSSGNWKVSLDGPLTTDPSSGAELASLAMTRTLSELPP